MTSLGCGELRVIFRDRCGRSTVCELPSVEAFCWTRTLDESSEAVGTITVAGDDSTACCDCLADVRSWRHEVMVLRDGELVWEGPLVGRNLATGEFEARDVTAWLDVRVVRDPLDFTAATGSGPVDLTTIAFAVIFSALWPDDPCIFEHIVWEDSGVLGEKHIDPNTHYAGEILRELGRAGLDYTTIGRRLLIGPDHGRRPIVTLTDEHFPGGLQIEEVGLEAGTRWIVQGDGVTGIAGGVDPYYGLIEQIAKEDGITQQSLVTDAARSRVDATNPPPMYIVTSGDMGLSPDAPVTVNDLVPGRMIRIVSTRECQEIAQDLRIAAVRVCYTADGGEQVSLALAPVGTLFGQRQPLPQ